jgi:hypothetical protein
MKQLNQQNVTDVKQDVKKPDSAAGLLIQAHLKISDVKTGEILLKTRG